MINVSNVAGAASVVNRRSFISRVLGGFGVAVYAPRFSFSTLLGETVATPVTAPFSLTNIPIGPAGTVARRIYRTRAGDGEMRLVAIIHDNTTKMWTDG